MSAIQQLITEHLDIWTAADTGPKSGRGRSSANAGKVYGVSKLRELILELAVRGKLVPQDAGDEPASELLKRIQAEKAKLVAEGKIRKGQPLLPISEDEKPFELPLGWGWARLGLVGDWGAGATPLRSISSYYGGATPWFKSGELTSDFIDTSEETVTELALKECSLRLNQPGDVLIAMYGATIGKAAILKVPGTTNQAVCACTPFKGVFNRYLLVLLKAMRSNFIGQGAGGAQPNISREKIIATIAAFPPELEQHRIVAKVDELMALCDQLESEHNNATEAHEKLVSHLLDTLTQSQSAEDFSANWQRIAAYFDTLFTTEASIDALKQTLLQLAVMGKLVPQDTNDEPASDLLKKIRAEKDRLIKEGKIKKDKPLAEIAEEEKPFALPSGWEWCRVGLFINLISGQHLNPNEYSETYVDGMLPYLTGPADFGEIYPVASRYTYETRALASKGDILITCKGSGVGKLNRVDKISAISRQLMSIQSVGLGVEYLFLIMDSLNAQIRSQIVGIAIPGISREDVTDAVTMLPPLHEQHRIVAKVDELMTLCDQLKSRLTEASQLQQKLADVLVGNAASANVQPVHTGNSDANPDQAAARTLLATEVVHQLNAETRMGRVKLQKVVNLAEYIANLREVASEPMRNAAGPHDRHFMDQVLQGMKDRQWYEEQPVDGGNSYRYRPLAKAGQHRADYEALWSPEQRRKISDLIALMRSWNTDQCERVATLYSAWNDLLIEGKEATEANILNEVLNRWNDSKLDYTKAQWQTELAAMKMHALLIPTGFGARTIGGTQTLQLH